MLAPELRQTLRDGAELAGSDWPQPHARGDSVMSIQIDDHHDWSKLIIPARLPSSFGAPSHSGNLIPEAAVLSGSSANSMSL